jgi:hypothetical protein
MADITALPPRTWSMVGCWVPHRKAPFERGWKFRPTLLLETRIESGQRVALVCAATGQGSQDKVGATALGPYEIELPGNREGLSAGPRLDESTRLDLSLWFPLPYTTDWFYGKAGKTLNLGQLAPSDRQRAKAIWAQICSAASAAAQATPAAGTILAVAPSVPPQL